MSARLWSRLTTRRLGVSNHSTPRQFTAIVNLHSSSEPTDGFHFEHYGFLVTVST